MRGDREIERADLKRNVFSSKSWMNRFVYRPEANFDIHETLYKTYIKLANNYLNENAVFVAGTGKGYTHKRLIQLIENASYGFSQLGIRQNVKVGIFLNGSIEEPITLLALNKLGAISKYIDYTKSISAIQHSIEESEIQYLIMDECFLPLEQIVNFKKIPVIVANTQNRYTSPKISFNEILCMGVGEKVDAVAYIKNKPSVIINSSGTTGEPKPIVHTDNSINAAAQKMLYTDYPITKGNVLIKMIPSQIGLGLITSLYTGLLSGVEIVLLSGKDVIELTKNLVSFVADFKRFKEISNLSWDAKLSIFTSPLFIRELINATNLKDLSFIGSMLAAGSKMEKAELEELNRKSLKKGCKVPVCNGYGQNEMAGAVTLNFVHHNVNGSAGFPMMGTDVLVVNQETYEILEPYKVGLILESSNSLFLGYEGMEEKTQASYIKISDGSSWYNTCDLGYMDDEGFLFVTGRVNRVVIKSDFKISLDYIEKKIRELPYIIDCAALAHKYGGSEENIITFIKANSLTKEMVTKKIVESGILSNFEMPSEIVLLDNMPYKNNGKIDYLTLEQMANAKSEA